ncbi:hypothetical protein [Paenibacillus macerans]|uniref:hypothetical protein n=1 Tax=Paenibacillus macerans TaxID=44252 RepID=UPI00203D318B|nr:hypothetical protein [Paenibacillus macerans]MCM3702785.1 hypothetical protein [Paenibacillus macerans]
MANNKWTKWCVGVSSAALFVGLIGLNTSHSDAANPSSSSSSSTASESAQNSDQFTYDHQGTDRRPRFEDFNGNDGSASPGTSYDSGNSGSGPESDEFSGMRSHAS